MRRRFPEAGVMSAASLALRWAGVLAGGVQGAELRSSSTRLRCGAPAERK